MGTVDISNRHKHERLAKFFGEIVDDRARHLQFAPQPPNVKMMKLKKIFGEAVAPSLVPTSDMEIREYNKRYRESLNEGIIKRRVGGKNR